MIKNSHPIAILRCLRSTAMGFRSIRSSIKSFWTAEIECKNIGKSPFDFLLISNCPCVSVYNGVVRFFHQSLVLLFYKRNHNKSLELRLQINWPFLVFTSFLCHRITDLQSVRSAFIVFTRNKQFVLRIDKVVNARFS